MDSKGIHNLVDLFEEKKLIKICAPMVRYSKLQFRTLVREYGCDLCFTPMILADSFCHSQKARVNEFSTNLADSPVVAQFASNTVHDFVGAAHMVSPYCNGVDLNCGCPQRWAKCQGLGCVMLENPNVIYDLVRQCRNHINRPFTVSVKMRLLSDLKKSLEICRQLEHCGVSFLTVHGRTPLQMTGAVNVEALRLINDAVTCPVIANGGVKSYEDMLQLHDETACKGIMVANGLLTNPELFLGNVSLDCVQKWVDICFNSTLEVDNYVNYTKTNCRISEKPKNLTFQCFHHHLVFMLEKILPKKTRRIFNNLQTFESVQQFLKDTLNITPKLFPQEKYLYYNVLPVSFNEDKYQELYENINIQDSDKYLYNSDLTDGKFFTSLQEENDDNLDTCVSRLFDD